MSDRNATRIRAAITEGRELTAAEAEHVASCETCRDAANRAHAFANELESALARRRTEPLPADPLLGAPPPGRRSWTTAVAAGAVVLFAIGSAAIGSQFVTIPGPTASAEPSAPAVSPSAPSAEPSPTDPARQIGPGTLAVVNEAAAILDEPGGSQWALLEPDHHVLVVDVLHDGETEWYRVEFEYCCGAGATYEWVFGWVAADLETAGLATPGFGIDPPEVLAGPTLQATEWACPDTPEELYRIPELVRHQCYDIAELITIRGVLSGGEYGEALYPGDPAHLTALHNATLVPRDMESGYRLFPLHIPAGDPLLLAWLHDERVKQGEEVEVTGVFGPGAVVCTKTPRLEGFPPMTPDEQQLWCEQQFSVGEIHGEGPDPIVEAPIDDALWTPPPGVQPGSGDGWRLLATSPRNQLAVTVSSETVDAALDAAEYLGLWLSQASGDPPGVDFSAEFVVQFVPPVSGTCPWIAFTGIGTDDEQGLMYGEFEYLSAELFLDEVPDNFGCTTDATPHAFLVAVDRSLAPGSEFRLRLQQERLCEECGIAWDETVVHLDDAER